MKILLANDNNGAHYYERVGLARAFSACGYKVTLWDINAKPATDIFDEFEPDIFIGQTYNLSQTLINTLAERPHIRVLLKAADWGPISENTNINTYPILFATDKEKEAVKQLKEKTGQPEYLFIYYHPDYIQETHGYWSQLDIPVHSQLLAADIFEYSNGQILPEFKCDFTFVGGHWPYKAKVLDRYLIPLCHNTPFTIKIYSKSSWPVGQYCGVIPDNVVKHATKSATICLNLSEPHAQDFGFDINERCYKLAANKCFIISDYVEGLEKIYGNTIVYAHDPEQFEQKIEHFIDNPDDRQPYIDGAYALTIDKHTYIHRIAEIFTHLNCKHETQQIMTQYPQILERLKLV